MILDRDEFLKNLDETIASHSMLDHPFYQLWNQGELSKETIDEFIAAMIEIAVKTQIFSGLR